MQYLFNRRKKRPKPNDTIIISTIGKQLKKVYLFVQSQWAQWMTRQTAKVSLPNLLVIWVFFIAFASGYSIYLIVHSLSGATTNNISVTPIVTPIKMLEIGHAIHNENSLISKNEFEKIIRFRIYRDSLARSPTGKKLLDSILNNRPGLADSLTIVENYYQSNFKNDNYGKRN